MHFDQLNLQNHFSSAFELQHISKVFVGTTNNFTTLNVLVIPQSDKNNTNFFDFFFQAYHILLLLQVFLKIGQLIEVGLLTTIQFHVHHMISKMSDTVFKNRSIFITKWKSISL